MRVETLHSAISLFEGEEMCPHCNDLIKQCPVGSAGPECSCGFVWHTGPESKWRDDPKTNKSKPSHYAFVTRR